MELYTTANNKHWKEIIMQKTINFSSSRTKKNYIRLTDFLYILLTHCIAVILRSLFMSNCNLVFTNHIGFVSVLAIKPAHVAEQTWTIGESAGNRLFQNCFACEYVQKYTALDGATPIRLGPRP